MENSGGNIQIESDLYVDNRSCDSTREDIVDGDRRGTVVVVGMASCSCFSSSNSGNFFSVPSFLQQWAEMTISEQISKDLKDWIAN